MKNKWSYTKLIGGGGVQKSFSRMDPGFFITINTTTGILLLILIYLNTTCFPPIVLWSSYLLRLNT